MASFPTSISPSSSLSSLLLPLAKYNKSLPYLIAALPLGVVYVLYATGKLPHKVGRVFGRLWHYVSLPPIIVAQALGLRGNLFDKVDENVYIGGIPLYYHVPVLKEAGINAVVNLCDEYAGPVAHYKIHGIEQLYIPTIDHTEPVFEDLVKAVEFIDKQVKKGNKVLIHCRAGRGRSAAVAFCWVLYHHGYRDLESAQTYLSSKRKKVRKVLYKQPNILKYYDHLQKRDYV